MQKELIINSTASEVKVALVENSKLVELHDQKTSTKFTVGDIFVGKIKKLMPGLNACFVDIGHKKDAFLHYTDLGPKLKSLVKFTNDSIAGKSIGNRLDNFVFEPEIVKTGKIDQVLSKKDHVLVQILKEPISTKGPRLSCEITIPGRFLVLTPFSNIVAISKKIGNDDERKRLKVLIESIRPKNFGIIVRTASEGKKVADLHEEMRSLVEKWEVIKEDLKGAVPPKKLLSEIDKTSSIIRDLLSDSFNKIVVDDKDMYRSILNYLHTFSPELEKIVTYHKPSVPIFEKYGITKQIKSSFGKTATMSSGAYLVIEHTEAMHVIDVNSGHKMVKKSQAESILSVNLESAEEIARQLRLRDLGGLIIVDFIDMKIADHKKQLLTALRDHMKNDRAQHTILPLSKFGLMQITRQRVRPEVNINTAELCPTCDGSGRINASILAVDDLERDLDFIYKSRPKAKIGISAHPYLAAYLKSGFFTFQISWYKKYYKWVKITANHDYHLLEYKFHDQLNEEIRMN